MNRGTACGKAILFGEHAVVYGVPAIAIGLDRGARAEAEVAAGPRSTLEIAAWNVRVTDSVEDVGESAVARAFADLVAMTRRRGGPEGAFAVRADADLPPGGGVGCSAALGVAIARALDPSASEGEAAARADAWERVFHGNPSGIDAAAASLGGCLIFERGASPSIGRVYSRVALDVCIGHSGTASSTRTMVESVARLRERRPETTQKAFDAIHTLVKNARLAIEAGDLKAIGQLLDLNQMLLSGLFVSTPEIEQMCSAAREVGALGAKLTGAGGGGCVLALVPDATVGASVVARWKADGFDGFFTTVTATPPERRAIAITLESSP